MVLTHCVCELCDDELDHGSLSPAFKVTHAAHLLHQLQSINAIKIELPHSSILCKRSLEERHGSE